ncbi:MAG: tetratricopeptide repeat protein [Oligoflexales bacterium]|nr:tetratricopeptide repeat protein [Oligoflexales bacterium]
MPHLNDFPSLSRWFHENDDIHPSYAEDPVEHTVWQFCRALTLEPSDAFLIWQSSLSRLLDEKQHILTSFQEIERFFDCSGASLTQIISSWGYDAFEIGKEDEYFLIMQKAAVNTGLVSFYFLAAWAAFNQNDYDSCLEMCDEVKVCYAPILTLKGQALLESGHPEKAIPVLEDALESDEREVLAWFQLAKAFWLEKHYQGAFDSLLKCLKLSGPNPEISLFLTIVALDAPYSLEWHNKAWEEMEPFLGQFGANEEFIEKLFKLIVRSNRRDWMEILAEEADWEGLKNSLCSKQKLGAMLKSLGEKQWFGLTKKILDRLIGHEEVKSHI